MYTYETQGNGTFVIIYSPDGDDVFLQGDDATQLLDELDKIDELDDIRKGGMIRDSILSEYFA